VIKTLDFAPLPVISQFHKEFIPRLKLNKG
jgi:hypothetical protein